MIIGIDGNEANVKNRVGVNKYAFEMIWGLYKLTQNKPYEHNLIVYLKNVPLEDLPKERENFKIKVIPGGGLWIITKLTPYLFRNPEKIEVLFSPSHYTPPLLTIPRVCSIMDLGYLKFSGQFEKKVLWQLKCWSAISILVSKQILTISESTKKDIVRHYPFASKKTTVTLLGYERDKSKIEISDDLVRRIKNRYSIVDDYILYLGTLKPSKNIIGLIDAFSEIAKNIKLVIAGKKGWMYGEIFERVKKLKLEDRVIFTDFFPEEDKPALIKGAKVFILPSFWEGFGLDIVTSMALGVPVVASNVGSLSEVVGEAGILIDPDSVKSIREGIEKVLNMSELEYNELVEKGLAQAKKFSWEVCSKKTLEIILKSK
ncbi:hypothetical protein A2422_02240 [Candidatus Woesebacteria bacterium RIFOXYC1_FULL_31_51]|nr:MAG: group 1 glycosyl transferase [Candidatus Woesebacteria bacterium GW2011_GWF1_31_35]KKP23550.1 MAG: Glycosyltransferase [Candidatus Woesebacteria bacterium GW2011_GWC1_30_29]KKP25728.1 MAG: Glycosyltransferase [Candidatus Woesebacteria bacterium GW2011_GWD1_31_12]KKP27826.1 MAG: Glycosyltransferase [Candidatus Woesebacteria bacterium GW2011_GWB1_31_29]KKP34134.1 MAG: Glycosyltransferase [Candidatus Woesebacteria bacterium GW2011_GWF2_32_16]KKP34500.1 MAG: Glycosyltransferase [Candidatus